MVFQGRRKTGSVDLEALEEVMRAAMHRAGAAALSQLLQFPVPAPDQRSLPCPCGQQAVYLRLASGTSAGGDSVLGAQPGRAGMVLEARE